MSEKVNFIKNFFDPSKSNFHKDPLIRKTILHFCINFLGGIWEKADPEDIKIKKLEGGAVNIILLCSLPDSFQPLKTEPRQVVFRIYCKPDSGIVAEVVICSILAEKNLGPKLYGIFDEGRIEEYIPSRPLTVKDICVSSISKEIAKQFAQIHCLNVPIKKTANFMVFIHDWFQNLSNNQNLPLFFDIPKPYQKYSPKILTLKDLKAEIEFIRSRIPKLLKNIVFCHNDLHGGNILLINDENQNATKLMFIDYEFASYNPRGFDLGHHFAEYVFDYAAKNPPYSKTTRIPSKEHMLEFILTYAEEQYANLSNDERVQKANELLEEILPFIPISYFFWSGYMINDGLNAKTEFDFIGFALERIGLYFMHKHYLEKL